MATTNKGGGGLLEGFSPASPPRIFWNSRKRSADGRSLEKAMEGESRKAKEEPAVTVAGGGGGKPSESPFVTDNAADRAPAEDPMAPALSERRRALFEPLGPAGGGARIGNEEDLPPPPDFDPASYPKGWLVGKKRKLVNVDVVESMRRIAVQEMNRKDREIDGLNGQLEEDARCLEHLQEQLLEERRKRAEVERDNADLQNQISMLMDMLQDADTADDGTVTPPEEVNTPGEY